MSTTFVDLERLQQLSYERSKNWATFLENVAKEETHKELDLCDLEKVIGPDYDEDDSNDDLVSMEDDECDEFSIDSDVLRNVTNTTRLSILFKSENLIVPADATSVNDENSKLIDLFNQTLPIINEHNRHLKKSGFDKILNTFDKNKIEEKVGSWLNRHNSLYGGDATFISPERKDGCHQKSCYDKNLQHQYKTTTSYRNYNCPKGDSDNSDDSLQSGETARYIRSSRASAMKNASSSSTTTMIKTYRMFKSKREALREKYACEQDDDETHFKSIRHHRTHYEHGRSQRLHKHQMYTTPLMCLQKRKVLRKRTVSNSCSTLDSSSDSDNYYYDKDERVHRKKLPCCSQHHYKYEKALSPSNTVQRSSRSAMKMPSSRSNRIYYYSHSKSMSSSLSSSSSLTVSCKRRRPLKSNCRFYNDNRPCKRESECHCCNERKLCQDYKHLADTSTEEWFVENCQSPKEPLKTPSYSQTKLQKSKNTSAESLPLLNENCKDLSKRTKGQQIKPPDNAAIPKETKKNKQKMKKKVKVSKTNVSSTIPEGSFENELQMAIEASKKLYEQEQRMKKSNIETKEKCETKDKRESKTAKPLRKILATKCDDKDLTMPDKKQTIKEIQTNRKRLNSVDNTIISKDSKVQEKIAKIIDYSNDDTADKEIFIKPQSKSLFKPLNKTKNSTITTTEEIFFAPTQNQVIYNSTSKSGDNQDPNRQFEVGICRQDKTQKAKELINNTTTATEDSSIIQQNINDTKSIIGKKDHQTKKSKIKNDEYNKKPAILKVETKKHCKTKEKHEINKMRKLETEQAFDKHTSQSKSMTKSSNTTENFTISSTDESFFAPTQTQAICNSTAQSNETKAYKRQFANSNSHEDKTMKKENIYKIKTQQTINNNDTKEVKASKQKTKSNAFVTLSNKTDKSITNKKTITSTVTSTTIRSPDTNSTTAKTLMKTKSIDLDNSLDEHSDCTLVTSTTNVEAPTEPPSKTNEIMLQQQQPQTSTQLSCTLTSPTAHLKDKTLPPSNHQPNPQTHKGIVIYTPQNRSLIPPDSFSSDGGYFIITKEYLSSIIGEKATEKFLKYYIGRRRFNSNSTIYFKPPSTGVLDTSSSESNSDDEFSNFGQYGELYESLNKNTDHQKHS